MIKIQRGIEHMKNTHSACVIFSGEEIVYESKARGIFPLYEAHEMFQLELEGCVLFDRIIGKAAAMIACDAGISYVYGKVMSDHAIKYLETEGIPFSYEIRTEYIENREKNGMCPVETRAIESESYEIMRDQIKGFLESMGVLGSKEQEKTLVIIKPDAVTTGNVGRIVSKYEDKGLKIEKMSAQVASRDQLTEHYREHVGKSFYEDLVAFMSEGLAVFLVLSGEDAIAKVREINGATDPAKADEETVRKQYGTSIQRNAVHGSENMEAAKREIQIWFNQRR